MRKRKSLSLRAAFIFLPLLLFGEACGPRVLTVRVDDEAGLPVENAGIRIYWSGYVVDPWNSSKDKSHFRYGLTNRNGRYTYIGWTPLDIFLSVFKAGYYETPEISIQRDRVVRFRIRKIGHPIAMYAKTESVKLPLVDGDYAYDLFAGDLVAPYGSGIEADIVFRVRETINAKNSQSGDEQIGDVTFPNADDGIQMFFAANPLWPVSTYQAPFKAPEFGYFPSLSEAVAAANGSEAESKEGGISGPNSRIWYWTDSLQFRGNIESKTRGYFIRVRSASAEGVCFGLVRGLEFYVSLKKELFVNFTYYLNPDHSTNIEFSPRLNSFKKGRGVTPGLP